MRKRFWKLIHDSLESAWHWVYCNKIEPRTYAPSQGYYQSSITFLSSKGEPVPMDEATEPYAARLSHPQPLQTQHRLKQDQRPLLVQK